MIIKTAQVGDFGFSLLEMMMASSLLVFGLLSAAQFIYSSLSAASLARSKQSAALVAESKLEWLTSLFQRNPESPELKSGEHGPELISIRNPNGNYPLNRFEVRWKMTPIADPRPGKMLRGKTVMVSVLPIGTNTERNLQAYLNKRVCMVSIVTPQFSYNRMR